MTITNNAVRAKIEVGNYNQIEADITAAFAIGEIVTGFGSSAFAEVLSIANIGDNYINVGDITGVFEDESLSGSVAGVATTNGTVISNGVKSHQQRIPATITTVFLVDEIVSGLNSTAFAKVAIQANPGDTFIVIKQRTRFFDFQEDLVGSIAGIGESNGSMTTGDELYTNPTYGIDNGLWTLETTGNLIASIDDSVMKINIDQGGNLATGYQFGFTLANFGLVDTIEGDGLFLKHLPTRYYIDFGAGYVQVWAGIIDTFPKTGDTTAQFKCTDAGKANIEKIGSDTVPIALNRNYNCKLVLSGDKEENFNYIVMNFGEKTGYLLSAKTDKQGSSIVINHSAEIESLIDADEFDNIIVEVVFGAGVGNKYNVVQARNGLWNNGLKHSDEQHTIWLDQEDISALEISNLQVNIGSSLISLKKFNFTYNLSQNPVQKIHVANNSNTELPLRIVEDEVNNFVSNDSYEVINGKQIIVEDIIDQDSMLFESSISDMDYNQSLNADVDNSSQLAAILELKSTYSGDSLSKILDIKNNNDNEYFVPVEIRIQNAIIQNFPTPGDPLLFKTTDMIQGIGVQHIYSKNFWGIVVQSNPEQFVIYNDDQEITIETRVAVGSLPDHYDLYITTPSWNSFKSKFILDEEVEPTNSMDSLSHSLVIKLKNLPFGGVIEWSVEVENLDNYTTTYSYNGEKDLSLDDISIGCNGENVQPGNEFENYPDTIEYIQENHIGIPSANINDASYDQAQADYDLFPSVTERNPSHQIIAQTDSNTILKDMLKASHLGMYPDRLGQYNLENWLPKSTVFSDSSTVADYTDQNWLPNGIGKISRSQITQVVSDFQLDYDFNESTGENQAKMRIKRTDLSEFDFELCTEGISIENYEIAQQAWELLRAGYLRAKKLTQTTLSTKWIKMLFSDGTGESEAINFIRNHAGHVNRELEKVTIKLPLNATDAIINLLSFISVTDQKRTNGETRAGWIIDHAISWKSKEVVFKILLDISQFDPFLVQINIIQDDATETEEIQNDALSTDIIQDGIGK